MEMYRVVCLLAVVSGAVGQLVVEGTCNYTAIGGYVTDLNVTRMLGTWNEIARIGNSMETGECSSLILDGRYDANGTLTGAQVSFIEVVEKNKTFHNGTIMAQPEVAGLLYANVTGFFEANFVVQSTDYTGHAILYSCLTVSAGNATVKPTKNVWAWQYHRKSTLSTAEQAAITELVARNPDLAGATWKFVSHNNTACGHNTGVSLPVPQFLVILATLFMAKEFV